MSATSAAVRPPISPTEALLVQGIAKIASQLEGVTLGHEVWRAADADGAFGMEFTHEDGPNPAHQCQQWMDLNKERCAREGYTLQRARQLSTEERLLAVIADQLRGLLKVAAGAAPEPTESAHG